MSEARRKPAGAEGVGAEYGKLMRDMGSPDGAWNPEPDGHITGLLREDVHVSPNESKLIAYVKACCTRKKAAGRTVWGLTDRGKRLTLARIADYFGWESGNASKYAKLPLACGFVRVNEAGVFGLGARVEGVPQATPDEPESACPGCGRSFGEDKKCPVCTYRIPNYVVEQTKGLSEIQRKKFVQGWVTRKQREADRIAAATKSIRQETQAELKRHCREFGLELKTLSVQTASVELSVQTAESTVYKVEPDLVQTENAPPIKEERKGKLASASTWRAYCVMWRKECDEAQA